MGDFGPARQPLPLDMVSCWLLDVGLEPLQDCSPHQTRKGLGVQSHIDGRACTDLLGVQATAQLAPCAHIIEVAHNFDCQLEVLGLIAAATLLLTNVQAYNKLCIALMKVILE